MIPLAAMAITLVRTKYPYEFRNPTKYGQDVLELINMVGDELTEKNRKIFEELVIEQFPTVEELIDSDIKELGLSMNISDPQFVEFITPDTSADTYEIGKYSRLYFRPIGMDDLLIRRTMHDKKS